MTKAMYPGTFDPVTNGHLDIVKRAYKLFENLTILVASHPTKKPVFSSEERVYFLKESLKSLKSIKIEAYNGLLADYVGNTGTSIIIRGLRAVSDFEYELSLALMNRKLNENIETIFLTPKEDLIYLSSTMVKQISSFGRDVSKWVPPVVSKALQDIYKKKYKGE